jgi:hypothetical protein
MPKKETSKETPRKLIIRMGNDAFYNTAIDKRFIDVFLSGYYSAIMNCGSGDIPEEIIRRAGISLGKHWPKLQQPKYEHLYDMDMYR